MSPVEGVIAGFARLLAYLCPLHRRDMLDILQAVSLLGLIITHFFLVRGCFSIKTELPIQGGILAGRLDRTAELLDEVAQLIADLGDATPAGAVAQPVGGFPDLLATFLNSRLNPAPEHGDTTQPEDWEVLPPNDDPTTTQDDQPDPSGSTIHHR